MGFKGLAENEVIDGVNVYRVKCFRMRKDICRTYEMISYVVSALMFLNSIMKEKKYDICHCHFIIPTGILALWLRKRFNLRYVLTTHGSDVPDYNPDRFVFFHKFTKPLLRIICNNAKQICSPSLFLKSLIKKNIGTFDVKHIPNGIDLSNFKLDLTKPKESIILSTGRLLKRKGFHTVIKAVYDVELPYEFHIVGDGPYRKNLEKMADGSKTEIIFHGWIEKGSPKLLELYQKAPIYILASAKENASIALLEGMAAKAVVITTNVSGCPETVGDAGFLLDYDDHEKLKEILIKLSQDKTLVEDFSKKAYERLVNNFLWDQIINDYIEVLK
jgi:glycosyltransferase involved in cell wall biosynthesis